MTKGIDVRVEVVRNAGTKRAKLVAIYMVNVIPCTPFPSTRDLLTVACDMARTIKGVRANDQLCAVLGGASKTQKHDQLGLK